ncbi:subtilisin-like protease SBT3 [Primulina huaijiensis]|uniref:subtilisin-like protease SBT3 n=1 Tax=Primulina huaijiensis TaxID=1492673 RepID=UPI003CC788EA
MTIWVSLHELCTLMLMALSVISTTLSSETTYIQRRRYSPSIIYTYTNSIHGFCASLSPAKLHEIKKHPAYLSSTRDQPFKLATTRSSDFLGLNSITGAWPASRFGRNIIIGVVDTGIWPESKSFDDEGMPEPPERWKGGCFCGSDFNSSLCNRKLIGARFFNKGIKSAIPHATLVDSARDTTGHGTHVASTAAGNFVHGAHYFGYGSGTARGMSPRASLAIYALAFDQENGIYASDLIAAIDSAIGDGIDVLSLSIASSGALWEDPLSIATFAAMEKGIFSIGYKIVACHVKDLDEASEPTIAEGFIDRGVAAAIVIIDNVLDIPSDEVGFPTTFLSAGKGKVIVDYINGSHDPRATILFKETCHGHKPSPKVAYFSSRGPSVNCPVILKPDVMAPGDSILASWQEKNPVSTTVKKINSFNIVSGTSMASPHVAGVAALLKGANPDWCPGVIRSAIMITAKLFDNLQNPIQEWGTNQTASPLAMGAGLVDPNQALDPGLVYDLDAQDYVNFLCGLNLSMHELHAITRSSHYACPPNPTLDLNYPSFIAYFNCSGTKSVEFWRTLTNMGSLMSRYVAKVDAMQGFHVSVDPDTLVFQGKNDKKSYKLTVEGPCLNEGIVIHGHLKWVEVNGKHTVTSPIAVLNLSNG